MSCQSLDEVFFAIIADDVLFVKVDDTSRSAFEVEGLQPFTYPMKDGSISTMSYYPLPDYALETPHDYPPKVRQLLRRLGPVGIHRLLYRLL